LSYRGLDRSSVYHDAWETNGEFRTFANPFTLPFEGAAMQPDEVPAERQTNAEPRALALDEWSS
jgi:hypothetical protein